MLSKALETNSHLTSLSLRGSSVGDTGAVMLSAVLRTHRSLTALNLRRCQLHAVGAHARGGGGGGVSVGGWCVCGPVAREAVG